MRWETKSLSQRRVYPRTDSNRHLLSPGTHGIIARQLWSRIIARQLWSQTLGTVFTAIWPSRCPPPPPNTSMSMLFKVDMNNESLLVLVNGEEVIFGDVMVLEFEGMSLLDKGNKTLLTLFSSGAFVELTITNGIVGVMIVGLPESMQRTKPWQNLLFSFLFCFSFMLDKSTHFAFQIHPFCSLFHPFCFPKIPFFTYCN